MRLVTVIVPSFNTRELTLACLGTLEACHDVAAQVITVDDASSDGSQRAIRERFGAFELLRHDSPQGFTAAVNSGLARSRGEILVLLNSDTEVEASFFDEIRQAFAADPELGIAGASLRFPDGTPQWSGGREPTLLWLFALTSGLGSLRSRWRGPVASGERHVDWVSGACLAMRHEVHRELGSLAADYRFYCQDLDYCLRAAQQGWRVAVIPSWHVVHHLGSSIRRRDPIPGAQHLELLWCDLALWAKKRKPRSWSICARATMKLGAALRMMAAGCRGLAGRGAQRRRSSRQRARELLQALKAI